MYYKETAHFLHFILTLLFFPWVVVWVWRVLSNSQHNKMVERMENRQMMMLNQHKNTGSWN